MTSFMENSSVEDLGVAWSMLPAEPWENTCSGTSGCFLWRGVEPDLSQLSAVVAENRQPLRASPGPGDDASPMPGNRDLPTLEDEMGNVYVDPHEDVVDPPPAGSPPPLVMTVQDAAGAFHRQDPGIHTKACAPAGRQFCRPLVEGVVIQCSTATAAEDHPLPVVTSEDMSFLDVAAHAPAREHGHRYVVGDVDRHSGMPATAAQAPHRSELARLDESEAFCNGVIGHASTYG